MIRDKNRTTQDNVFDSYFRVWNFSSQFLFSQLFGYCFSGLSLGYFSFFRVVCFTINSFLFQSFPQEISHNVSLIDFSGMVGRCFKELPSILMPPLAKPANRVIACLFGLMDPWAMRWGLLVPMYFL